MYKILLKSYTVLFSVLACITSVHAHESETYYDRISLSANATEQVANDTMVAKVYSEEEGSKAAELSERVNENIRWGLGLVKKYPDIKHQTNAYSSHPIYNNNKIKGWRVRQSLQLESQDMALMSKVLGRMQKKLALESMRFTISPESKEEQDKILIDEALAAFEKRARQVVVKLRRNNYKIVDMNISTTGARGVRPQYEMRAMSMDSAPAVSAGEQTLSVTVSGTIELE